jgi:hypothetical protein
MRRSLWIAVLLLAASARAEDSVEVQATFGAVESPVALPAGGAATYGYVGVPEVGAGYRQGIGPIELEGRLRFNYFDVSLAGEALVKLNVFHRGPWDIAPLLGVGLVGNSGTQYIDGSNFSYLGVRILPGAVGGYRWLETLRLLGELDVPVDIGFGSPGGNRVSPLLGGGAELYIGDGVSALALGQVGFEALKAPIGVWQFRFNYQVRLGLGWRLF